MNISHAEFGESCITFEPFEREVFLVMLKAARSKYESPKNLEVIDYFICAIEAELTCTIN